MYILRAIGSLFVRFMAQPPIYSFQGSDMFILSRTVVRVKAIHPTTDFIGRGFLAEFYNAKMPPAAFRFHPGIKRKGGFLKVDKMQKPHNPDGKINKG